MTKTKILIFKIVFTYLCLLIISFILYFVINVFDVDIPLTTNLLIWTATIFAPLAFLLTYSNWKEQKSAEIISNYSDQIYRDILVYLKIVEGYSLTWPKQDNQIEVTKKLDEHYEKIRLTLYLYCDFLRAMGRSVETEKFQEFERQHYSFLLVLQTLDDEEDVNNWSQYSGSFSIQLNEITKIINVIMSDLIKTILHLN